MPASGGSKLVDANAWRALVFSDHVHHGAAKAWFDAQSAESCGFCRVTQRALLRHLTNPYFAV
jgi:predicted nucleic acid-binding protein